MFYKPFQIMSLRDMLHVHAENFIEMGVFFQWIENQAKLYTDLDKSVHDTSHKEFLEQLQLAMDSCDEYYLKESRFIIRESIAKFKLSPPTVRQIIFETETIKRSMIAGLSTKFFFQILPHRTNYLFPGSLLTENTLSQFPSVKYDIREAGWCFATERFTAAVHHLMRVAEYGLVSFAEFCGVGAKDRLNWNKALNDIEKCFRDKNHPNYKGGLAKEDEQYYIESLAWLRDVKTAWRNPVSHIPKVYDEEKARGLFQTVRNLMGHLSIRFKEAPMPPRAEDEI